MPSVSERDAFRGPYADGPPAEALLVDAPPLQHFGLAELRRFFLIVWHAMPLSILTGLVMFVIGIDRRQLFKPFANVLY